MIDSNYLIAVFIGFVTFGMFVWMCVNIGNIAKNLRSIQRMMADKEK